MYFKRRKKMTAMIMKAMGAKKGKILMRSTVMAAVMTIYMMRRQVKAMNKRTTAAMETISKSRVTILMKT